MIRPCTDSDIPAIFEIVNDAAQAYKGVIPADRWHEPYMPLDELQREIADGVEFWGYEEQRRAAGRDGHPGQGRRVPDPPCLRSPRSATGRHRHAIAQASRVGHEEADPDRHLGRRRVGGRFLPAQRLPAPAGGGEEPPVADLLADSPAAGRDLGGAGRRQMGGRDSP